MFKTATREAWSWEVVPVPHPVGQHISLRFQVGNRLWVVLSQLAIDDRPPDEAGRDDAVHPDPVLRELTGGVVGQRLERRLRHLIGGVVPADEVTRAHITLEVVMIDPPPPLIM
jgi:hypothetical protein